MDIPAPSRTFLDERPPDDQHPVSVFFNACNRFSSAISVTDTLPKVIAGCREAVSNAFEGLLQVSRECDDPLVFHALGHAYDRGFGVARDADNAREWFLKAAELGHAVSMVRIGHHLLRLESPEARRESLGWYRRAADLGCAIGMVHLGFAYRDGIGVGPNYAEAVAWFLRAVNGGDRHAMVLLGRVYSLEVQHHNDAVRWLLRAAAAGFSDSYSMLADLFADRRSPVADPREALTWYLVAAQHPNASGERSMLELARRYRSGCGITADATIAREWLQRLLSSTRESSSLHKGGLNLLREMNEDLL